MDVVRPKFAGLRLAERRRAARMTQYQLASSAGISLARLRRLEHCKAEPTAASLYRISLVVNASMSYLLGRADDPISVGELTTRESRLILSFRKLGADAKTLYEVAMVDQGNALRFARKSSSD